MVGLRLLKSLLGHESSGVESVTPLTSVCKAEKLQLQETGAGKDIEQLCDVEYLSGSPFLYTLSRTRTWESGDRLERCLCR